MSASTRALALLVLFCAATLLSACGAKTGSVRTYSRKSKSYAVVETRAGDTAESLANRYLKDPAKAWAITEYNGVSEIVPGQFLVVPLQPPHKGGLAADGLQVVPVLAYSAFAKAPGQGVALTQAAFDDHLRYLKDHGYVPVSIEALYNFLEFKEDLPTKAVVITIDDTGQNTWDVAYPVLKKYGFPAAVFVCTDLVTGKEGALSWDKIKEMGADGISIQHQTKTLRNLTRRKTDETFEDFVVAVDREMTVATLELRERAGITPAFMAYPYGAANELVIALLRKNGFRGAVTLSGQPNPFYTDNFLVSRKPVTADTTLDALGKSLEVFQKSEVQ
ncbi:MAG: polysaccharide deacetylase family protein [Thermodesulfobacteriota bacterium]